MALNTHLGWTLISTLAELANVTSVCRMAGRENAHAHMLHMHGHSSLDASPASMSRKDRSVSEKALGKAGGPGSQQLPSSR